MIDSCSTEVGVEVQNQCFGSDFSQPCENIFFYMLGMYRHLSIVFDEDSWVLYYVFFTALIYISVMKCFSVSFALILCLCLQSLNYNQIYYHFHTELAKE